MVEGNLEFKLRLNIDFVPHPARTEGLVNAYIIYVEIVSRLTILK